MLKRLVFLLLFFPFLALGQSVKKKAFDQMVDQLLSHTVDELKAGDSLPSGALLLDAREKKEYSVSHLEGARYVGYDSFKVKNLEDIDCSTPLVVYCSVGYRSEKIAEKLKEAGYQQVYNLVGGIFEWHNEGYQVVNVKGDSTNKVHGYNKVWGQWLDHAETVYK